jgi:hypothetical protein
LIINHGNQLILKIKVQTSDLIMKSASVYKANFSNMSRCVFFMIIFIPAFSVAQSRGTVTVIKDARIDTLIARRAALKAVRSAGGGSGGGYSSSGYRVQIFSGSGRKDAYNAQAKFKNEYPAIRTYITYREPNFKVNAGDFRSRIEAEKMMQELRGKFTSLFIIPEKINPPKADTND